MPRHALDRCPRSCGPDRHSDPPKLTITLQRVPPSSFAQVVSRERPEQSRVVPEDGVRPRTSLCVDGARDRTGPPLPLVQRSPLAEGYDWWATAGVPSAPLQRADQSSCAHELCTTCMSLEAQAVLLFGDVLCESCERPRHMCNCDRERSVPPDFPDIAGIVHFSACAHSLTQAERL